MLPNRHQRSTVGATLIAHGVTSGTEHLESQIDLLIRRPVWRSDANRCQAPDFVGVLLDGAVRRELTHVGDVEDRLLGPFDGAAVGLAYALLAVDVRAVVGKQEVVISTGAQERLEDTVEQIGILGTKEPVADLIDHPS